MAGEHEPDAVQRHHEETVAETAESLLTFENAPLPLSIISPEGDVMLANRAMRALLGYEFGGLVGKSVLDLVAGEPSGLRRAWAARIRADSSATPERAVRLRGADGSELPVRVSSVLVRDSQGAARYVVARAVRQGP